MSNLTVAPVQVGYTYAPATTLNKNTSDMPYPTLIDDGRTVTLDLHGASVDDAVELARRTLELAARRGRSSVKLIHGQSTTSQAYQNRTIKTAITSLLDSHKLSGIVSGSWLTEGYVVVSLDATGTPDANLMRGKDIGL